MAVRLEELVASGAGSGFGKSRMSSPGQTPEAGVVVVAPGEVAAAAAVAAAVPVAGSS